MQHHFLYSEVIAPPPPDWLIQQGLSADPEGNSVLNKQRGWGSTLSARILTKNGKTYPTTPLIAQLLGPTARQWAETDIYKEGTITDIRYTHSPSSGNSVGPHRDVTRNYAMIFLLSAGGNNVTTTWYTERNGNAVSINNSVTDQATGLVATVNDYSLIEQIGKVIIPDGVWFIINTTILHSVENIVSSRCSIQIGFDEFPSSLRLVDPVYYTES
jgi:hypothetical protein